MSMTMGLSAATIRGNEFMRSEFLETILKKHEPRLRSIVQIGCKGQYRNLLDEARQAFLMAANAALETARDVDDGRGRNSLELWCVWRGLNSVRDFVRNEMTGRIGRKSMRQRVNANMVHLSSLNYGHTHDESNTDTIEARIFVDPNDYAEEAVTNMDFTNFLGTLKPFDRQLAMLLAYGRCGELELHCVCNSAERHSYIQDLAVTLKSTEGRIFKSLHRLRSLAGTEFGIA